MNDLRLELDKALTALTRAERDLALEKAKNASAAQELRLLADQVALGSIDVPTQPRSPMAMVREFHETMGCSVATEIQQDLPESLLRFDLLKEELQELGEALFQTPVEEEPVIDAADALADIVYVAYGAALVWGIDLDKVIAEVHRSNMTKTPGLMNDQGKILKGPGYQPPEIAKVLKFKGFKHAIDCDLGIDCTCGLPPWEP